MAAGSEPRPACVKPAIDRRTGTANAANLHSPSLAPSIKASTRIGASSETGAAPSSVSGWSNGGPLVGGLRDLGERLFPERQLLVRSTERVRSVLLPGWLQAMIVVACIGTLGGASYLTVGYFSLHREADRVATVASNESAATGAAAPVQANSEAQAVAAL